MSTNKPHRYTPLPPDGEWTRDASWAEVTSLLANPDDARRALHALRRVFPASRVRAFEGEDLHPLELDYLVLGARLDLIELGLALAVLNPRRATDRLRNRLEYRTMRAELQAGLMLSLMGAHVEHEPTGTKTGPDWLASWAAGQIGVEVKCLATGRKAQTLMLLDCYFAMAFIAGMNDARPTEAAWLTTRLDPTLVGELVIAGRLPNRERIEALAMDAAEQLKRALPTPTVAGTYSVGRAGTCEIALGPTGAPRFHINGDGLQRDETHEFGRVYDEVQRAANQLRAVDSPGLVVLDLGRDRLLTNHYEPLRVTLQDESWATELAGVLFVDRSGSGSRSHTVLHLVPGKLFETLVETLGSGMIFCDRDHMHAPGLLGATEPCDCPI
ncbi:MAG: hypothetical protein IT379_41425 [Deltaproteobacteria bacterium]|nr:hypothetical protein [Deltaproteobacteria bacterium]